MQTFLYSCLILLCHMEHFNFIFQTKHTKRGTYKANWRIVFNNTYKIETASLNFILATRTSQTEIS